MARAAVLLALFLLLGATACARSSPQDKAIVFTRTVDDLLTGKSTDWIYREALQGDRTPRRLARGAAPAVSRTGLIAFARRGSVLVMNTDGTNVHRVAYGSRPTWSPDGRWIAFQAQRTFGVVHADGSSLHFPVRPRSDPRAIAAYDPQWSPDSKHIAFIEAGGYPIIAVADVNATRTLKLSDRGVAGGWPAWSPDGQMIAHVGDDAVEVANPDGSNNRVVAAVRGANSTVLDTAWGKQPGSPLAFTNLDVLNPDVDLANPFIVLVDTGALHSAWWHPPPRSWVADKGNELAWSPYSTRLAYSRYHTSSNAEDGGIYILAPNTKARRLPHTADGDTQPAWSPV